MNTTVIVKSKMYGDKKVSIDKSDLPFFQSRNWFVQYSPKNSTYYIICNLKAGETGTKIFHRMLLGITSKKVLVDHINGEGLDNRRVNLRRCSPAQNACNARKRKGSSSSKYKGVSLNPASAPAKPYMARVRHEMNNYYLGVFKTEIEAARAYNKKAKELHGDFAKLNIIPEDCK